MTEDSVPLLAYVFVGITSFVLAYVTINDKESSTEESSLGLSSELSAESSPVTSSEEVASSAISSLPPSLDAPSAPPAEAPLVVEAQPLTPESSQPSPPEKINKMGGKNRKTKSHKKKISKSKKNV